MRYSTLGFNKIREISWVAEDLLDSQEGICPIELVCPALLCLDVRARKHQLLYGDDDIMRINEVI